MNTKENTVYQLTQIRNKPLLGSVLFSYRATNPSPVDRPGTFAYIKQQHQPVWVEPPPLPWKASPTKGILRGTVTRQAGGQPLYNAQLTLHTSPARTQKTGPHGQFAFFETPPGTHTLTATARDLGTVTTNITIAAGENLAVTLALPLDNTPPVFPGRNEQPHRLQPSSFIGRRMTRPQCGGLRFDDGLWGYGGGGRVDRQSRVTAG